MARLGDSLDDNVNVGTAANTIDEFEKVRFVVTAALDSDSVDRYAFIAIAPCTVTAISEVHTAISTGSGLVTVQKLTSTGDQEIGSTGAVDLMSTGEFDLTATAGVVQTATLSTASGALSLTAGQRIGLDFSGDMTSVAGTITINLYQDA